MNRILLVVGFVATLFTFGFGCGQEKPKVAASLSISIDPSRLPADGGSVTITVKAIQEGGGPGSGKVHLLAAAGDLAGSGTLKDVDLDTKGEVSVPFTCDATKGQGCSGHPIDIIANWNGLTEDDSVTPAPAPPIPGTFYNLSVYSSQGIGSGAKPTMRGVNSREELFLSDGTNIWIIVNGQPSIYVSADEIRNQIGGNFASFPIDDLTVGPDDNLYAMISAGTGEKIFRVTGAHQIQAQFDIQANGFYFHFRMKNSSTALVIIGYDGLYEASASGTHRIYDNSVLGISDCALPDFALLPDGFVFYTPGCNGSGLYGGPSDGTQVSRLISPQDVTGQNLFENFDGFASIPNSTHLFLNLEGEFGHIDELGHQYTVNTSPSVKTLLHQIGGNIESLGFYGFYPVISPNNVLYLVGGDMVIKGTP